MIRNTQPATDQTTPLRVLTLRGCDGAGGGAEKIVLRNAVTVDPKQTRMKTCFIRGRADTAFDIDRRAQKLGIDYCEIEQRFPFDPNVLSKLRKLVQQFQPQIVHAHDYKSNYYAHKLSQVTNALPVSTMHGWTGHHWKERFVYYPAERFLFLRKFPVTIAVSSQIRNTLISAGGIPERIRVVLNGVDTGKYQRTDGDRAAARAKMGVRNDQVIIGAVGRLEPQKRFDILIDTFAGIADELPNLHVRILGEGSQRNKLQNQINRLNLSDRCQLLGHRADLLSLYPALDLLVQSSDYEGTPTVVVEAMALQIPIVATDAGGTGELITDQIHGLVVPCRDQERLAQAIRDTLKCTDQTKQRIDNAEKRVRETLSYAHRTAQLESIYQELASSTLPQ